MTKFVFRKCIRITFNAKLESISREKSRIIEAKNSKIIKKLIVQIVGPNFIFSPFRILRENYTSVEILKREIRMGHLRNDE